jgi:dolichol-phosphate mannosyltransferase
MIPQAPEISVIIPARNEAGNLRALLEEIEAKLVLPGLNAEVVVVDDGSTDGTPELLREFRSRFQWLVCLRHDDLLGQSAALSAGVRAARWMIRRYPSPTGRPLA